VPGLSANFDSNSSAPCSPSPLTASNNGCVTHATRFFSPQLTGKKINVSDNLTRSHPLTAST
jgi:hypothetical protein